MGLSTRISNYKIIGGGTGWGLRVLLLMKIRDNYPDRITATFPVYLTPKVSEFVVEPYAYNAILSIQPLLENSDNTLVIDNESSYIISHNILKQQQPKYAKFVECFLVEFCNCFIFVAWRGIYMCFSL